MAKYVIDEQTLIGLGDAIRSVTGSIKRYTPEEMIEEITDILNATTFVLVDENGNEYAAAYVDSDVVTTAGPNDIRKGYTAITAEGLIEGEKEIPNYRAEEGYEIVKSGQNMDILLFSDMCHYTVLQAIICDHDADIKSSVSAEKVVIDGMVYNVGSTEPLAAVSVDHSSQIIKLGISNDSDNSRIVRYMIIKEDT